MGLSSDEHAEDCPVRLESDHNAAECDCERDEFSSSRCDGCGSWLAGSRWAFNAVRIQRHFRSGIAQVA